MKILTLCGSLRRHSANRAILYAYERLASAAIGVTHYERAALLPHFNPDLDGDEVPEEVAVLRRLIAGADILLISTPEYVHALPGSFKNILDWLVSDPAFAGKPVVILHVSRGSFFALNSLKEFISNMSAKVLEKPSVLVPLESNQATPDSILEREDLRSLLLESIALLPDSLK